MIMSSDNFASHLNFEISCFNYPVKRFDSNMVAYGHGGRWDLKTISMTLYIKFDSLKYLETLCMLSLTAILVAQEAMPASEPWGHFWPPGTPKI